VECRALLKKIRGSLADRLRCGSAAGEVRALYHVHAVVGAEPVALVCNLFGCMCTYMRMYIGVCYMCRFMYIYI